MNNLIIIPTYNERDNIANIISNIRNYKKDAQILVVDDNSPDGTSEIVINLMKNYPNLSLIKREKKMGLGAAYIEVLEKIMLRPRLDNIVIMDADGSHDPKNIPIMLDKIKYYEMVIGSRYVSGGNIEGWKWHRKLLSKFANLYCRFLLRSPIHDLTAGFVCFRKEVLNAVDFNKFDSSGYVFQVEFKHYALKAGCSFAEIPIIFKDREKGDSKISLPIILEGIFIPFRLIRFGYPQRT